MAFIFTQPRIIPEVLMYVNSGPFNTTQYNAILRNTTSLARSVPHVNRMVFVDCIYLPQLDYLRGRQHPSLYKSIGEQCRTHCGQRSRTCPEVLRSRSRESGRRMLFPRPQLHRFSRSRFPHQPPPIQFLQWQASPCCPPRGQGARCCIVLCSIEWS